MKLYTFLLLLSSTTVWASDFRVGTASVVITPPVGMPLTGYYYPRLAEGTHDDLYTKALVMERDGLQIAIVACDLIRLARPLIQEFRREIQKVTGIPPDQISISATHSHTGPALPGSGVRDDMQCEGLEVASQYMAQLPHRIAESVRRAVDTLQPARAWAGTGRADSLVFNRRFLLKDGTVQTNPGKCNPKIVRPAGPVDPTVHVVYLDTPGGKPLATWVNFALHLDTVGGAYFSADYVYTLSKLLAQLKGPEMLTFFTIGTAGNINHIDVKNCDPQKGHAEAARIGTVLAGEVLKTYARLQPIETSRMEVRHHIVLLETPKFTPDEIRKARADVSYFGNRRSEAAPDLVWAFKVLDIESFQGKPIEAEVHVVRLGDFVSVSLPGEVFVELGLAIKQGSPFPHTIVNELGNGSIVYVPNRKAYAEGSYEVVNSRCVAGSGELLVNAALRLLNQMHGASP